MVLSRFVEAGEEQEIVIVKLEALGIVAIVDNPSENVLLVCIDNKFVHLQVSWNSFVVVEFEKR